jgi:hypothetical protein
MRYLSARFRDVGVAIMIGIVLSAPAPGFGQPSRVFRDDDNRFTFRYPSDWSPVEPAQKATRILLYAQDGSEATANVSVIKSDRPSVRDFDSAYFQSIWARLYHSSITNSVRYISVLGKEMAVAEGSFVMELPSGRVAGRSLVMATIHRGNRVMLVINGDPQKFRSPAEAFDVMVGTFYFQ